MLGDRLPVIASHLNRESGIVPREENAFNQAVELGRDMCSPAVCLMA